MLLSDSQGKFSNMVKATAWEEMKNVHYGLLGGAAAAFLNKFYYFGGAYEYESSSATNAAWYYDPAADGEEIASMPEARWFHDAAVYDYSVYVLGGRGVDESDNGSSQSSVWRYYPDADTWDETPADLPISCEGLQAVSFDGKLYSIGGWSSDSSDYINDVYAYDPAAESWTEVSSMREARRGHGAVALNGRIYVFGRNTAEAAARPLGRSKSPPFQEVHVS
ncbi:MAG: kelch repeat-containing protein, partial [Longimicrobiales bacterium]